MSVDAEIASANPPCAVDGVNDRTDAPSSGLAGKPDTSPAPSPGLDPDDTLRARARERSPVAGPRWCLHQSRGSWRRGRCNLEAISGCGDRIVLHRFWAVRTAGSELSGSRAKSGVHHVVAAAQKLGRLEHYPGRLRTRCGRGGTQSLSGRYQMRSAWYSIVSMASRSSSGVSKSRRTMISDWSGVGTSVPSRRRASGPRHSSQPQPAVETAAIGLQASAGDASFDVLGQMAHHRAGVAAPLMAGDVATASTNAARRGLRAERSLGDHRVADRSSSSCCSVTVPCSRPSIRPAGRTRRRRRPADPSRRLTIGFSLHPRSRSPRPGRWPYRRSALPLPVRVTPERPAGPHNSLGRSGRPARQRRPSEHHLVR
jgi:hypothetical protein